MKVYSFADDETGKFSRKRAGGTRLLPKAIPHGHIAVPGAHDHICKRFDLRTGEVVDHQPPAPDSDHEWTGRRWVPTLEAKQRTARDAIARIKLEKLDLQKVRPLTELVLQLTELLIETTVNAETRERLIAIEAAMVELRKDLKKDG